MGRLQDQPKEVRQRMIMRIFPVVLTVRLNTKLTNVKLSFEVDTRPFPAEPIASKTWARRAHNRHNRPLVAPRSTVNLPRFIAKTPERLPRRSAKSLITRALQVTPQWLIMAERHAQDQPERGLFISGMLNCWPMEHSRLARGNGPYLGAAFLSA